MPEMSESFWPRHASNAAISLMACPAPTRADHLVPFLRSTLPLRRPAVALFLSVIVDAAAGVSCMMCYIFFLLLSLSSSSSSLLVPGHTAHVLDQSIPCDPALPLPSC